MILTRAYANYPMYSFIIDAVGTLDVYFHTDCTQGRTRQPAVALWGHPVILSVLHYSS